MAAAVSEHASPAAHSRSWEAPDDVDRLIMGRLLNAFVRELGGVIADPSSLDAELHRALKQCGLPFYVELQSTSLTLCSALRNASETGLHVYAGPFLLRDAVGSVRALCTPIALAEVLLAELATRASTAEGERCVREMLDEIATSAQNTRVFARAALQVDRTPASATMRMLQAERGLVFGHPFHPAPKGGVRVSPKDLARYRPELGASFRLEYVAVDRDIVAEGSIPGQTDLIPSDAKQEAEARLPAPAHAWALLPVHPWQDRILRQYPDVASLVTQGRLIRLGPLGEIVHATSSVRTVYAPRENRFIKLAIDARITNFVRSNPLAQLERSMLASQVLSPVLTSARYPRLAVLPEVGYRTIRSEAFPANVRDERVASFGVLFREGPPELHSGEAEHAAVVVAALLEPGFERREAPLAEALHLAARSRGQPLTAAVVGEWAARYFENVIVPLLSLFIDYGISLEAHVQNTLVVLEAGWPTKAYVRDLEGTTVSRTRALEQGFFGGALSSECSMLVDESEACTRLLYYVMVNHAAHVVASLASCSSAQEWQLWLVMRTVLQDTRSLWHGHGARFMDELLRRSELPAKANLLSRFHATSEHPLYVAVQNPLSLEVAS